MPQVAQAARHRGPRYARRVFLRLAAGATASLFLPACRHTALSTTPEPIQRGWTDTSAFRRASPWKLGRSSRGDINPWMVMFSAHVEYGVQEAYHPQFGDFFSLAANWDPNKQIEDIQALLSQRVDLLLIDPLNTTVVTRGVQEAMKAGIPVILAASRVAAPFVSWVAMDVEKRGRTCAEWLGDSIAGGRVVALSSRLAAEETDLWLQGVRQQLEQQAGLEPEFAQCDWSVQGAQQAMADLLQGSDPVSGVIVQSGVLGRGVVQACREARSPVPPVAGVDDWNGWLRTATEQGVRFLALSGGANLGLRCVELATQVLSGQTVPTFVDFPYETFEQDALPRYYRPDLSDHYWAVHDLPERWIERMFKV